MKKAKVAVVAVGGNSLITDRSHPDVPHQWDAIRETCRHLADIIEAGWNLVITHGNGPQVGYIMRRNELAAHEVHTTPLDLIVADTQGSIGYMLQQALRNELRWRKRRRAVVAIVTQVLVNRNDPAFKRPTKPIGGFMSETRARAFESEGWKVVEDAGRGWRRVVASPKPLRVIEEDVIRSLLAAGDVVIAVGGGGIPVVQNKRGELRELGGVYAVIDKDHASSLLAQQLKADLFLISTGVETVKLNFGQPDERSIDRVTLAEAKAFLAEGKHFAEGSMKPKMESVVAFLERGGKHAIITSPDNLRPALDGKSGTHVIDT